MHARAVPSEFCLIKRGDTTMLLRKNLSEELLRLGVENPWSWVKPGDPAVRFYSGRTEAAAVTLPVNGGLRVVLRRYHHGGLLRFLQKDLYFFSFPPLREMAASQFAQQRGIPVAEILGAVQQRVAKIFYRVDLLLRHLPEGCDLGDYFEKRYAPRKWQEKKEIIREVGRLVRRMHDAGLDHADLHLKNIFMSGEPQKRNFYLLDFDKAHIVPNMTPQQRRKNLQRFHRYLEKYFGGIGIFTRSDRMEFLKSYFGSGQAAREFARLNGKNFERHVSCHRLLWPQKIFDPAWIAYAAVRGVAGMVNRLPEKPAYALTGFLAILAYFLDGRHRRRVMANLKIAFGDSLSKKERRRRARENFRQIGYLGVECLRSLRMKDAELDAYYARFKVEGVENLREGLRRGKGILFLVSHFGNWEISSLLARHIGMPLHALAKPIKNRWIDAWINRVRARLGIQVIRAARLNREILGCLAQNHAVAMLIDQNPGLRRGEPIPFFGKAAPTTTAPAYFALKSGAAVIPAYGIREEPGRLRIVIEPPLKLAQKKDLRDAMFENTRLFAQNLEQRVRQHPEQWWWVHNRWKTKKILVKMPNWVGDALMATPALRQLRRQYPQAHISVLAKTPLASLFEGNPNVTEVIETPQRRGIAGIIDRIGVIRALKEKDFDTAYIFPRSWDSVVVPCLARIPNRIGYGNAGRGLLLGRRIRRSRAVRRLHQADYYLHLVRKGQKLAPEERKADWVLNPSVEQWAEDYFRQHFRGKKVVGVAPGATYGSAKMWSPERYRQLAERLLRDEAVAVVFLGNQKEAQWLEPMMRGVKGAHLLAGKTTLPQLASLMKRCRVVVTNDSGPMHVAAAVGAPLVTLFGPTDYERTGPLGPHTLIRKPVSCSPCMLRECPIDHRCMTRITVDEVYTAVQEKLK